MAISQAPRHFLWRNTSLRGGYSAWCVTQSWQCTPAGCLNAEPSTACCMSSHAAPTVASWSRPVSLPSALGSQHTCIQECLSNENIYQGGNCCRGPSPSERHHQPNSSPGVKIMIWELVCFYYFVGWSLQLVQDIEKIQRYLAGFRSSLIQGLKGYHRDLTASCSLGSAVHLWLHS
jgi:hypothetical protein